MANRTDEMTDASVKARTSKKKEHPKKIANNKKKAANKVAKVAKAKPLKGGKTAKKLGKPGKAPAKKKKSASKRPRAREQAPKPPIQREVHLTVERQLTKMGETVARQNEDNKIDVRLFATEPAVVTLKYGLTFNFGNFEGCRLDVGLSLPCYAEERDDAYEEVTRWVSERVEKEREEILQHKQKLFTV